MAKQKKPAAVMARPNSTWFQNALKSVGAVSGDIIKDILPYTSDSVGSIVGVAKDVRNTIRKSSSSGRMVSGQLEKNSLIQMGRKALQNAAEDLKTGNLYNRDRDIDFGGDFNFDDVDMSFGDFDEGEGSDYGDNTVINNVNTVDTGAVLAVRDSVDKQTNATIAGATATVNTMVAVSSNMMMTNQKNMGEVLSHLSSIDTNIASMITYMNENVTKFIEASIAHYQEMSPAKNDENSSSSSDDKATSATIFGDSGFNANEYVKYVKQNIQNSTAGGLFGLVKDLGPMIMGGAVSNPIGTIAKAVGNNMISKDFKKSLKLFDNTLKSFIPTMLERLSEKAFDYAEDGAKGTLMRTIGSIFGVRTTVKNEFARKEYKEGPTPFDNETKLAITEVIPSYLRDILAEISGKEKQVFDKQTMKFRNISELQNEIYGDIYSTIIRTFKSSDVGKKLSNRQSRLDTDDQEKFEDLVNRLYLGLSRSSGEIDPRTLGSDDALTKYLAGGDAAALNKMKQDYGPILSYLTEALNSLSESEKSSINFTKIRARQNREARKREMEAAPDLYNLNLTNDGITIDQGMNEYHKRAYSGKNNATVVGTSSNKRYNPRTMMEDIASIKSILYRGINVKIIDEFGEVEGQGNNETPPSGGNGGGNNPPKPVGHSVEEARRAITEEQELSAELAQYDNNRGGAPTRTVNTVTNFMQAMINGGPAAASDVVSQAVMNGFSKAQSWLSEHVFNPMSKIIFGDKEKDENDKGIFGGIKDSFSDMVNGAIHSLTGKGYTKKNPAEGEDAVVADSENSLAHKAKKLFNNIKEGAAEYLFGKKNEETGKREGGFIGSMKKRLSDGLEGWAETIFGKSKEGEPTPGEKLKGYIKKSIPSALGGHVIGTMVSSLMGGSVLGNAIAPGVGGLIGAGIGMVSRSQKFKNWLFGHEDKDGKYIRGVLSKKTQQTLKENKNMILGGGALGLLKGLIFPSAAGATGAGLLTRFVGGPVAGMLMGAGLGMVKKSKWFQELMYGRDDPNTGKHINGIKDKLKNFFSKSGGKDGKSGGGYKGGMALLGGVAGAGLGKLLLNSGIGTSMGLFGAATMPILGGVMGAGLGILNSSEKFRKMMFGDIDEETGKRKGNGLIGKLGMWMNVNIMEPMKYGAEYVKTKMVFAGRRMLEGFSNMLDPLKTRINQIKDSIIDRLTDFRHGLMGVVKNVVVKPLKKAGEVMMVPLRFIGKQGFKLGTALLKAPMDALSLVFKTMTKSLNLKNIKGFIKDGWKHAKRAIGDSIKRFGHNVFESTFGVLRDTLKKHMGNESKFGKFAKKWLAPVQKAFVDGAKGIMSWIKGGIKKILGFPFKALGWAISAPFKILGKTIGAVGKVVRTGVGAIGVATNARESDENGNAVGPGMRDKLKQSLDEKAQEWAKKTGRDPSEYRGPRKWFNALKLLDPGYARLDTARRNGEIRDIVTVTDKNGKTHNKKLNRVVNEEAKWDKKEEEKELERLRAKYHLPESRKNAKKFKYDPTKKEEILGEDRVYEGITAKAVANIDKQLEDIAKHRSELQDALKGSRELTDEEREIYNKQTTAIEEGNETSAEIADVVRRGGEPGSIYTHDVHSEGILQSIYTFLVRRFSGTTVSQDDLDKISNPHLNDGIVSDVTDNIFEDVEIGAVTPESVSAELATPDGSASMEDTIKNLSPWDLAASGADSDTMESFINGDDAVLAVQNSELRLKDEGEDEERNEKQEAKAQAGLEKAQTDAKRLREEAAKKEEEATETSKKQTNILSRLLETTKSHTKSWFETFDLKKGLITAGIITLAPFVIKLIKSVLDGSLFGGLIGDILNCLGTTVSNIFSNFGSNGGVQGVLSGAEDVGGRVVEMATFDPSWTQNSQGDVDSLGSATIRYATKNGFKIANNAVAGFMRKSGFSKKVGAEIAKKSGVKKVLAKATVNTTKSLAHTGGVTKAVGGVTKKISELIGSFVKWLGKKFPKIGAKAGQKIGQKLTGEVVEKVAKKGGAKIIGAATAKTVTAALSFGASELVWGIFGGIDGLVKAARLFEVREEDVDGSMRAISTVFCALLGTTIGTVLDIIAGVAESIIGTNFIHEAAQLIWSMGHSEEEQQYYQNKKEMFRDDWRQEAYIKYKEQAEKSGEVVMSQEDFLASGDENIANASGLTLSEYNTSQNKDIWGHIGDFFGSVGKWFGDKFGGTKKYVSSSQNDNAELVDTKWAGGVVTGDKPRLTILSPGEIVYNPAGPAEREYQRRREEAARDKIYSRLSLNADANELGSVDINSAVSEAEMSPEYIALKNISDGVSNIGEALSSISGIFENIQSIKDVTYGMYGAMLGVNAFKFTSSRDIESASKASDGVLVNGISSIERWVMKFAGFITGKKYVKVESPDGGFMWVDEDDAYKYNTENSSSDKSSDNSSGDSSGSGRGNLNINEDDTEKVGQMKLYQQEDPTWNQPKYEKFDIYNSGCGPTAAAIAASAYGSDINPVGAASIINSTGYRDADGGTRPAGIREVGKRIGVDMTDGAVSSSKIIDNLKSGRPVILMGKDTPNGKGYDDSVYGDGMHYVVGTSYDERTGNVEIMDPLSNKPKRRKLRDFISNTKNAIYTNLAHKSSHGKGGSSLTPFIPGNAVPVVDGVVKMGKDAYDYYSDAFFPTVPHSNNVPTLEEINAMTEASKKYDGMSFKSLLKNKDKEGYEWVDEVNKYWKSEYGGEVYSWLLGLNSGYSDWVKWLPIDVYDGFDWKSYYKAMGDKAVYEYSASWDGDGNMTHDESTLPSNQTETQKDFHIKAIIKIMDRLGIKPSEVVPERFDPVYILATDHVISSFTHGDFLDQTEYLKSYCEREELKPYVHALFKRYRKIIDNIYKFAVDHVGDVSGWILENKASFFDIVNNSNFVFDAEWIKKVLHLLISNRLDEDTIKYMAQNFSSLRSNDTFNAFANKIFVDTTCWDMNYRIPDTTYLKGKTITFEGNAAQCEVVRLALNKFESINYSVSKHSADECDSAHALSMIYSSTLPIPNTGIKMYSSGKAITISIGSSDDDEIASKLYAGDILLYRDKDDSFEASIRHVEMYAGDGWMIGHSGGTNGNTKGFHAAPFTSTPGNLKLSRIKRFIKMDDTTIHTVTVDMSDLTWTMDGEDPQDSKTSIFDKLLGFIPEVISRVWNGLLTGEWDMDYSSYWSDNPTIEATDAEYASNNSDENHPISYTKLQHDYANGGHKYNENGDSYAYRSTSSSTPYVHKPTQYEPGTFSDITGIEHGHGRRKLGRKKGGGRYGRGNQYTATGDTTVLPKGLGWYSVNEGWSAITAPSPQLDLRNKTKEKYGSLYDSNGYAKYGDRYVVATTQTFGDAGDYIDIEQSDGNTIPAVIGDIKAWGVDSREGRHVNKWGHNDGDVVLEFLKDSSATSFSTNPTDIGDPMYSTLYGKTVSSITNRGSAFSNDIPVSPSNVRSRMSYAVTKHSGTPGANTLSPLSEGYEEWANENGVKYGDTCPSGESVYDNPDAIYRFAPRPDGTSTYAGAEIASDDAYSGTSYTSSNSSNKNNEDGGAMSILQNAISATVSRMTDFMFNGGELKALTEKEIRNGVSNSSGSYTSSSYSADGYYTYPEDDGDGALPDSLIAANDEYGKKIIAENAEKLKNDKNALYDSTLYKSIARADGWFLNSMPGSYKSSSFGEVNTAFWDPCHKGIDIAAARGSGIYTPVDGTVSAVVPDYGNAFGNYITIIDDKKNYRHIFAHQSAFADGIDVGTKVKRGDLIGYVGSTGKSSGNHLHYQIDASGDYGSYINPNKFPFTIYNKENNGDINETEPCDTTDIEECKGGRGTRDPLAVYKALRKTIDESKVQAQRSKRDAASESFNKSYGKGGDSGLISTARLESLTETMINILNTIADNTLSSSEKLDNIKSSAINLNLPKNTANTTPKKSTNSNSPNSPSTGVMSSNEKFARQIARGI